MVGSTKSFEFVRLFEITLITNQCHYGTLNVTIIILHTDLNRLKGATNGEKNRSKLLHLDEFIGNQNEESDVSHLN